MDYYKELMASMTGIETKIGDYSRNTELKMRELSDEILQLKQSGPLGAQNFETKSGSPNLGLQLYKSIQDNLDTLAKVGQIRLEVKAAGDPLTTAVARSIMSGGPSVPTGMQIGIHNALPRRTIGSTTAYEYSRYTSQEGAAAVQTTEGTAKAAIRPVFSLITETAKTIAGFTKISKQALLDSVQLQQAVNTTVMRSCFKNLDSILTGGTGTWGGLNTLATASTSLIYTKPLDAASEAVAAMQEAGFTPDVMVMTPAVWLQMVTLVDSQGQYQMSYALPAPENLRGLRWVLSPSVTAGKVMVLDSAHCELLVVEDFAAEIGLDADDFTKNLRTLLGELRVIPTFTATGAARLVTPKA